MASTWVVIGGWERRSLQLEVFSFQQTRLLFAGPLLLTAWPCNSVFGFHSFNLKSEN
jgi:hypothetical protein